MFPFDGKLQRFASFVHWFMKVAHVINISKRYDRKAVTLFPDEPYFEIIFCIFNGLIFAVTCFISFWFWTWDITRLCIREMQLTFFFYDLWEPNASSALFKFNVDWIFYATFDCDKCHEYPPSILSHFSFLSLTQIYRWYAYMYAIVRW